MKEMENDTLNIQTFKRKMLLWMHQWAQKDAEKTVNQPTPDAMDIIRLLQTMGYHQRYTDRCLPSEMQPVPGVPLGQPSCRVIIMCPHSGLRTHMDAATPTCGCPPPGAEVQGTGNALVPQPNPDLSNAVAEIVQEMLSLTGADMNQNTASLVDSNIPRIDANNEQVVPEASLATRTNGSLMRTPLAGIIVITPDAPNVPRKSMDKNTVIHNRYRSLDTLISSRTDCHSLPEPGELTPKKGVEMEVDDDDEPTPKASSVKLISRSSPAIHTDSSSSARSNAFVFEDEVMGAGVNGSPAAKKIRLEKDDEELGLELGRTLASTSSRDLTPLTQSMLLLNLRETQRVIGEAIHLFMVSGDNVPDFTVVADLATDEAKEMQEEHINPKRRLSVHGGLLAMSRAMGRESTTVQRGTISRRRSSSSILVTPTSSRNAAAAKSSSSVARVKSASTTSLPTDGSLRGSRQKTPSVAQGIPSSSVRNSATPRVESMASGKAIKQSVASATASATRRVVPNPKYAHVQSSIPKTVRKRND